MTAPDLPTAPPAEPNSKHPAIAIFTSHWLAMTGAGFILVAIVLWAILFSAELRGGQENPYVGIGMVGAGILLVIGATLTPIGLYRGRRRLRTRLVDTVLQRKAAWRRFLAFVVVISAVNLVIVSQMTMHVLHGMESTQFCGSCHVMTPESRAFAHGPHASILCVDCHVGEGTRGLIESKLQGIHQLIAVLTDSVHMPIRSPLGTGKMIPSEQTCENCHWKQRPLLAKLKLYMRYNDDEENTPDATLLTMNLGGPQLGGIHGAHNSEGVEIRFVATDPARQDIPLVEYRNKLTGEERIYVKQGRDPAEFAGQPRIKMQCFDCHNRPAHVFKLPDRAVDDAITLGQMSASLPFLKKTSVEILKTEYESSAAAAQAIPAALLAYYEKEHPTVFQARRTDIEEAGAVLAEIYGRNVFPELKVNWGTYPNNLGHEDFPGCYRCHDEDHKTADGKELTKNCYRCHFPAAVGENEPEVLETIGVDRLLKRLKKK